MRPCTTISLSCRADQDDPCTSEISELMAVKSKYSNGGEYAPDWHGGHVRPCNVTLNVLN